MNSVQVQTPSVVVVVCMHACVRACACNLLWCNDKLPRHRLQRQSELHRSDLLFVLIRGTIRWYSGRFSRQSTKQRAWMQNLCVETVNDFSLVCQIMQMKEYNYLQLRWAVYWNTLLFLFLFFSSSTRFFYFWNVVYVLFFSFSVCLCLSDCLSVSLSFMCVFTLRSWSKYINSTASADVRIQLGNCNSLFSVRASSCL